MTHSRFFESSLIEGFLNVSKSETYATLLSLVHVQDSFAIDSALLITREVVDPS